MSYKKGEYIRFTTWGQAVSGKIIKKGLFGLWYLVEFKTQWDAGYPVSVAAKRVLFWKIYK